MENDAEAVRSISELASALYRLLPASGDRSFWSVADSLGLSGYWNSPDKAQALRQVIEGARRERTFGEFIEATVLTGIAQCREDGVPVTQDELAKIARATEALGVTIPSLRDPMVLHQPRVELEEEPKDLPADHAAEERRRRVLRAHAELYSDILTGSTAERLLKLANVLGGLAMANGARVELPPKPQGDSVQATICLGKQEYALDARWSPEQVEEGLDALAQRVLGISGSGSDRRGILVAVEGVPTDLVLDAEQDRWTVLLDGHDLTLLLEDRWTLEEALSFKDARQRQTSAHSQLPLTPPSQAPLDLTPESRSVEVEEQPELKEQRRATGPDGEQVIPPNPMDFDRSIDDELESGESEERRLRLIRLTLLAIVVVGIVVAMMVVRGAQGVEKNDLALAENTVKNAVQARSTALRDLDATGLERYFGPTHVAQIADLIARLRAEGVFFDSSDTVKILRSEIEDGRAFIAVEETVTNNVRTIGSGELRDTLGPQRQTVGFVLDKGADGRWRVQELVDLSSLS